MNIKHSKFSQSIPCLLMRGGTSRGAFFLKSDLPDEPTLKDKILLAVMGSPDKRQIDGIGGANSLTSKVAILSKSQHPSADVDFLFAQVGIAEPKVDYGPSCGNLVAAVAPAAIEKGIVTAEPEMTTVRIHSVNNGSIVEAQVQTPSGRVIYDGDATIHGVPGSAAPIFLDFMNIEGSKTGKLFPTGSLRERIQGIEVTCIDIAVPMVIASAAALGKTGCESPTELDRDTFLLEKIEKIRCLAGKRMGLGNVADSVIPKFGIIAPPQNRGSITSRYFVPDRCHAAHAVTGAICVSVCAVIPGTVAHDVAILADSPPGKVVKVVIEHPSGNMEVELDTENKDSGWLVKRARVMRTARLLFSGNVHLPGRLYSTPILA